MYASTIQVLEGLYRAGKARAIGVSNYNEAHVAELLAAAEVKPMVNQVCWCDCVCMCRVSVMMLDPHTWQWLAVVF